MSNPLGEITRSPELEPWEKQANSNIELAQVRRENERLRTALEPFAARGRAMSATSPDLPDVQYVELGLSVGDFRRAAAALK